MGGRRQHLLHLGLSYPQATMKWALTHPEVASVAVTLTSFAQIREMTAAVGARPTRSEVVISEPPAKTAHGRTCEVIACERAGINPAPTKESVGAGFIPARGNLNFAGASSSTDVLRPTSFLKLRSEQR